MWRERNRFATDNIDCVGSNHYGGNHYGGNNYGGNNYGSYAAPVAPPAPSYGGYSAPAAAPASDFAMLEDDDAQLPF